jgi:hypothetical protein
MGPKWPHELIAARLRQTLKITRAMHSGQMKAVFHKVNTQYLRAFWATFALKTAWILRVV